MNSPSIFKDYRAATARFYRWLIPSFLGALVFAANLYTLITKDDWILPLALGAAAVTIVCGAWAFKLWSARKILGAHLKQFVDTLTPTFATTPAPALEGDVMGLVSTLSFPYDYKRFDWSVRILGSRPVEAVRAVTYGRSEERQLRPQTVFRLQNHIWAPGRIWRETTYVARFKGVFIALIILLAALEILNEMYVPLEARETCRWILIGGGGVCLALAYVGTVIWPAYLNRRRESEFNAAPSSYDQAFADLQQRLLSLPFETSIAWATQDREFWYVAFWCDAETADAVEARLLHRELVERF